MLHVRWRKTRHAICVSHAKWNSSSNQDTRGIPSNSFTCSQTMLNPIIMFLKDLPSTDSSVVLTISPSPRAVSVMF